MEMQKYFEVAWTCDQDATCKRMAQDPVPPGAVFHRMQEVATGIATDCITGQINAVEKTPMHWDGFSCHQASLFNQNHAASGSSAVEDVTGETAETLCCLVDLIKNPNTRPVQTFAENVADFVLDYNLFVA